MKRGQLILRGAGALLAAVMFFYTAAWVGIQLFGDDDRYLNPVSYTHLDVYKRQLLWGKHS